MANNKPDTTVVQEAATEPVAPPLTPTAKVTLRFYANDTDNARAPIAHCMIDLPSPLDGTTIEASMFARRDNRGIIQGIDVSMPSYRGTQLWRPMPLFVTDSKGVNHPIERSANSKGADLFTSLPAKITEQFYRWQKNPTDTFEVSL